MTTWPPTLPNPNVDYSVSVNTSVVRTKMDSGRFRQRRRFTRDFRTIPVTWTLTDEEYGLFQAVYKYVLNSGADWFYINLPLGDGVKQYKARFIADSYNAKYQAFMHWNVSAKLETEDEPTPIDGEVIAVLAAFDYDIAPFEAAVADLAEITEL